MNVDDDQVRKETRRHGGKRHLAQIWCPTPSLKALSKGNWTALEQPARRRMITSNDDAKEVIARFVNIKRNLLEVGVRNFDLVLLRHVRPQLAYSFE